MGKKIENYRRLLSVLLCVVMLAGVACGCQKSEQTQTKEEERGEIHIPVIFTVNPTNGKKSNQQLTEAFNEEYDGIYQVDVEWVLETEEEYRQNLKRQNVTDSLPAVITDLRMLPSFYQMMIEDGRLEDLAPYLDADEEWRNMVEPAVVEACMEEDGAVYLAPISTAAFSCSGMFWNKELFEKAGIERFPETWEEFWECCDRLQSCGITPLALHTEGTGWAPMLIATAAIADTSDGAEFMKELFPDTYQNESGVMLAETLKKLFSYTTDDAMHADFDVSFTNFFSGEAAMIPNGYWMIEQIPDGWRGKTRFSAFPGNKLISSPETFGWAVVSDYSDEVKKGAVEFLKFRTKYNREERERLMKSGEGWNVPALSDYIDAFSADPQIVPNYQVKWNSILQEETLEECLPELAKGKITVEEFLKKADESIREYEAEQ